MKINRFFGTLLCFFPGAAHLYLGLKKQGVQLMSIFLVPFFLTELLRISGVMFVIPIIWFYGFFDGIRKINGYDELVDENIFIFDWLDGKYRGFGDKNRMLAYGLIGLGGLLMVERILMPVVGRFYGYWVSEYIQMGVISTLLILGGVKLLMGSRQESGEEKKW